MRRPLVLSLTVAVLSGLCAVGTAQAAPTAPAASAAAEPPSVPGELLVGYVKGAKASDRDRARGRAGAQREERVVAAAADRTEVELVRLPAGKSRAQAEKELESDPAVAYAEPNWIYQHEGKPGSNGKNGSGGSFTPSTGGATADIVGDPLFRDGSLWGMYGSGTAPKNDFGANAAAAWSAGTVGAENVVIGVIDEGIQHRHPDLHGQVANPGEQGTLLVNGVAVDKATNGADDDGNGHIDDAYGYDFVNNDTSVYDGGDATDVDDHGTHVAGTIGARADTVGVVGVSQKVTMISGKFLGSNGGTLANAIRAVDYFTVLKSKGVNVVATNNSWGGGGYSQGLLDAIVRAAEAQILFIAAAGNSGTNNDRKASYPSNYDTTTGAGYDAVVAVAAIDKQGALASFSQYGSKTVDLGAPGVGVVSTVPKDAYATYSGTSMATPHVSGAIALYAAKKPGTTAGAIRHAVLTGTIPTASLSGKTVTGGRLDAHKVLLN